MKDTSSREGEGFSPMTRRAFVGAAGGLAVAAAGSATPTLTPTSANGESERDRDRLRKVVEAYGSELGDVRKVD